MKKVLKGKRKVTPITKSTLAILMAGIMTTSFAGCAAGDKNTYENTPNAYAEDVIMNTEVKFKNDEGTSLVLLAVSKYGINEDSFLCGYVTYDETGMYFEDAMTKEKIALTDLSRFSKCDFHYTSFSSICKQEDVLKGVLTSDEIKIITNEMKIASDYLGIRVIPNKEYAKHEVPLEDLDIDDKISLAKNGAVYDLLTDKEIAKKDSNILDVVEEPNEDEILLSKDNSVLQLLITHNYGTKEDSFNCGYVTYNKYGVYFENAITGMKFELSDDSKFESCRFYTVPFCSAVSNYNAIDGKITKQDAQDIIKEMKFSSLNDRVEKDNNIIFVNRLNLEALMNEVTNPGLKDLTTNKNITLPITKDEVLFVREDNAELQVLYIYDFHQEKRSLQVGYITICKDGIYVDDALTDKKEKLETTADGKLYDYVNLYDIYSEDECKSGKISKKEIENIVKQDAKGFFDKLDDDVINDIRVEFETARFIDENVDSSYSINGNELIKLAK